MTINQALVILSPFLFPPKKSGKKKRRMKSKNHDFKSCLSTRSQLNKQFGKNRMNIVKIFKTLYKKRRTFDIF